MEILTNSTGPKIENFLHQVEDFDWLLKFQGGDFDKLYRHRGGEIDLLLRHLTLG